MTTALAGRYGAGARPENPARPTAREALPGHGHTARTGLDPKPNSGHGTRTRRGPPRGGPVRISALVVSDYCRRFRHARTPTRPVPNNSSEAGSGTGSGPYPITAPTPSTSADDGVKPVTETSVKLRPKESPTSRGGNPVPESKPSAVAPGAGSTRSLTIASADHPLEYPAPVGWKRGYATNPKGSIKVPYVAASDAADVVPATKVGLPEPMSYGQYWYNCKLPVLTEGACVNPLGPAGKLILVFDAATRQHTIKQ